MASTRYDTGPRLVFRFIRQVFPEVDHQLKHWMAECGKAEDSLLSTQALASIQHKKFHAQGGSIYALYPNVPPTNAVRFIVALQTISDYLDNLCDRSGVYEEASFRQLHLALLDAVDLEADLKDYYLCYPCKSDSGYLKKLVEECRDQVARLPSYALVADTLKKYVQLYSDLQSYKHLALSEREGKLSAWAIEHSSVCPDIFWWEFSAAAGSTLGIFLLYAAACDPGLTTGDVESIDRAYFPWICGLHILLDYYIDAQEDQQMGDLNFTSYYDHLKHCEQRLSFFVEKSLQACSGLRYPDFHITIVKGLLSMYLSDPKADVGMNRLFSRNLIRCGGEKTEFYYQVCKLLRSVHKL